MLNRFAGLLLSHCCIKSGKFFLSKVYSLLVLPRIEKRFRSPKNKLLKILWINPFKGEQHKNKDCSISQIKMLINIRVDKLTFVLDHTFFHDFIPYCSSFDQTIFAAKETGGTHPRPWAVCITKCDHKVTTQKEKGNPTILHGMH